MGAVRARDQGAFMALYQRHAGRVNGFALKLLGSADEAEEVVEDVFLQVWVQASDYEPALRCAAGLDLHDRPKPHHRQAAQAPAAAAGTDLDARTGA